MAAKKKTQAKVQPGQRRATSKESSSPLLVRGQRLLYRMADDDVSDTYLFSVEKADAELVLSFRLRGEKATQQLRFSERALASARGFLTLSQGSVSAAGEKLPRLERSLPPFLLSREVMKELASTGEAELRFESRKQTFALRARGTLALAVGGQKRDVAVLSVESDDATLLVVDDGVWPLVLEQRHGDESYWKLAAIGPAVSIDDKARPAPKVKLVPVETDASRASREREQKANRDPLAALASKESASAKARAMAALRPVRTPEVRRALLALLGDPDDLVRMTARDELQLRLAQEGLFEDARFVVARELPKIKKSTPQEDPAVCIVGTVFLLARCEPGAYQDAVAGIAADLVGHPHPIVRAEARSLMLERGDASTADALIGRIDKVDRDDPSELSDVCNVIAKLDPDSARTTYERLAAGHPDLFPVWARVIDSVPREGAWKARWFPMLLDWWLAQGPEVTRYIERSIMNLATKNRWAGGSVLTAPVPEAELPKVRQVIERLLARNPKDAVREWRDLLRNCGEALPKSEAKAVRARIEAHLG